MVDKIISIAVVAFIVIGLTVSIIKAIKKAKIREEEKSREVDDVIEKHGVRYTPEATIVNKDGTENVTYVKGDILIKQRNVKLVGKHEDIKPGKWTVLSTNENVQKFNIRIGTYVEEYHHGQEIILSEGDKISPTSTSIILR